MSPAGGPALRGAVLLREAARALPVWTWLSLPALTAAVAVAAEIVGGRAEVYCGAAAGLLLGLIGHLFAARAVCGDGGRAGEDQAADTPAAGPTGSPPSTGGARYPEELSRREASPPGSFLRVWAAGFLVRFVLVGLLAGAFGLAWPGRFALPMLSMGAVYLALHFLEIAWLWRSPGRVAVSRSAHG